MLENNLDLHKKENGISANSGCFICCLTWPFLFLMHSLECGSDEVNCCPKAHLVISWDNVSKTAGSLYFLKGKKCSTNIALYSPANGYKGLILNKQWAVSLQNHPLLPWRPQKAAGSNLMTLHGSTVTVKPKRRPFVPVK